MIKQLLILSLISVLFALTSSQASAQIIDDTLIYVKSPAFVGKFDRSAFSGGGFTLPSPASFTPISKSAKPQQIKLPAKARVSSKPVTLKKDGNTFTFSCQQDCRNCRLFWWDRNKDGKVQPKRELRCACTKEQTCKIQVRQE